MIIKRHPTISTNDVDPPSFGVDGKDINTEDSLFNQCPNTVKQIAELDNKKFQEYEDKILNLPIFRSRIDGPLIIEGNMDVNNQLNSVIDTNMLVGRNFYIQKIVQFLQDTESKSRLLHLYGPEGYGQSDIANYSGKYALYGRVELEGAIYVEAENRNNVSGLITKIYKRLAEKTLIPEMSGEINRKITKELIFNILHERKYLIIIDKCQLLIEAAHDPFNKFLGKLVNRTLKTKFIVISQNKDDISSRDIHKQDIEIPELSKLDSAKLLMHAAKESKYLKGFKSEGDLSQHEIFKLFQTKPQVIVQIAQLLKHKSLQDIIDERKKQIEDQKQKEIEHLAQSQLNTISNQAQVEQIEKILPQPEDDINLIMKMSFDALISRYQIEKFPYEYELLYILFQMPAGLFESDLEQICIINKNYADWRYFFNIISDNKQALGPNIENTPVDDLAEQHKKQNGNKEFKFLTSTFNVELEECQFVPIPQVKDYINSELQTIQQENKIKIYFDESLKYIAILLRRILRARTYQQKNEIDHKCVSAVLDTGIWSDEYGVSQNKDAVGQLSQMNQSLAKFDFLQNTQIQTPVVQQIAANQENISLQKMEKYQLKSILYEPNFINYLDLKVLQQHYPSLKYSLDSAASDIQELCICFASLLIEQKQYEDAAEAIEKGVQIAEHFKLLPMLAKLKLIRATLSIRRKDLSESEWHINQIRNAATLFQQNKGQNQFVDGVADSLFLQAILQSQTLIKALNPEKAPVQVRPQNLPIQEKSDANNQVFAQLNGDNQLKQQQSSNAPWNKAKYNDEIQSTRRKLKRARNFFVEKDIMFGVAKTYLVEAEFLIKIISLQNEYDLIIHHSQEEKIEDINDLLFQAKRIFSDLSQEHLFARSEKDLGVYWYKMFELYQNNQKAPVNNDKSKNKDLLFYLEVSKSHFENALMIYNKLKDKKRANRVNELLSLTLEKIRQNSRNVLIFAKAFPLVEEIYQIDSSAFMIESSRNSIAFQNNNQSKSKESIKSVGLLTKYKSSFRKQMMKEVIQSNQVVNVKFDILNMELLQYVRKYGCKILHLSSSVFEENRLCIEGPNGVVEYLYKDQLKKILANEYQNKKVLDVELLVLAIPESTSFAKLFLELGVKHVIAFSYEHYVIESSFISWVYDFIDKFCKAFYKNLFQNQNTIEQSFVHCINELFEFQNYIINKFKEQEKLSGKDPDLLDGFLIQQGPKLFPEDSHIHNQKLFQQIPQQQKKGEKKEEKCVDTSKIRRPTNLRKLKPLIQNPFTGRKTLVFELMQDIMNQNTRIVNVYGPEGIGKSRMVIEAANYMSEREFFKDGIFYIDLMDVSSTQEFKDKTSNVIRQGCNLDKESDIEDQLKNTSILLVMDHIEDILSSKGQFDWNILTLINVYQQMKIIVISRNSINQDSFESIKDKIVTKEVPPLELIEAADLIQTNCNRVIVEDLIKLMKKPNYQQKLAGVTSVHDYLVKSYNVKECYGFPKYLIQLAKQLDQKGVLDSIDIRTIINPRGKQVEIQEYYKTWEQKKKDSQVNQYLRRASTVFEQKNQTFDRADEQNQEEMDFFEQLTKHGEEPPVDEWLQDFNQQRIRSSFMRGDKDSSTSSFYTKNPRQTFKENDEEEKKEPLLSNIAQYPSTEQEEELQFQMAREQSLMNQGGFPISSEENSLHRIYGSGVSGGVLGLNRNPAAQSQKFEPSNRRESDSNLLPPQPSIQKQNSTVLKFPFFGQKKQ